MNIHETFQPIRAGNDLPGDICMVPVRCQKLMFSTPQSLRQIVHNFVGQYFPCRYIRKIYILT